MALSCARLFCSKPAPLRPVLVLRSLATIEEALHVVRMPFTLAICPSCQPDIGVKELIDDGTWDRIVEAYQELERRSPDRSLTQLEWTEWA